MRLFEWLGEFFTPGPVGDIDTSRQPLFDRGIKNGWAIFSLLIGFGLSAFVIFLIGTADNKLFALGCFALYLLLSYLLTPKPDASNLGWLGGLINNPFRISDDANRLLVLFYLFLLPGKLIVYAIQRFYRLIKYNFIR